MAMNRSDWPRQAKALPQETIKCTAEQIVQKYKQTTDAKGEAKHALLTQLLTLARQKALEVFAQDRDNPTQTKKKLSDVNIRHLTTMLVAIPDEWRQDPPDIDPIAPIDPLPLSDYWVLHRTLPVAIPPVLGN